MADPERRREGGVLRVRVPVPVGPRRRELLARRGAEEEASLTEIHPLTLRFDDADAEAAFVADFQRSGRWLVRGAFAIGIALNFGYAAIDPVIAAGAAAALLEARIAYAIVLAGLLAVTFTALFERRYSWVAGLGPTLTAVLFYYILVVIGDPEPDYYTGLALVLVAIHTLFRLRFPIALGLSALVVAGYAVVAPSMTGVQGGELAANLAFLVSAAIVASFASYSLERFARLGFLDRGLLAAERERSEALLLNVLPEPIAVRLKAEAGPIADDHAEASILFGDIVGFTARAATMGAGELVGELNRVFTAFDRIVAEHGVEKIKTIGDAYMAVAGVPLGQPDHLERIAEAALAMRSAVEDLGWGERPLELRLGIDTGPVVAGVIGEAKFSYDLWGDPVNTASRMESHGVPGAIHVTEAVVRRLEGRYRFTPRGPIEVKGKGRMETWLLEGRVADGGGLSHDRRADP